MPPYNDSETWWVAKDACDILGIGNVSQATSYLDDDERGVITNDTRFSNWETLVVSESGLYSLIFRSRKPEAKAFKRWVTHEVLPSIRRTGQYTGGRFNELQSLRDENAVLRLKTRVLEEHSDSEPLSYDDVASMLSEYMEPPFGPKHLKQWLARHGIHTFANHKNDQPTRKYINRGWFTVKVHKYYRGGKLRKEPRYLITWFGFNQMLDLAIRERLLLLPPYMTQQSLFNYSQCTGLLAAQ